MKRMPASAEAVAIPATAAVDMDFVLVLTAADEVCVVMDPVAELKGNCVLLGEVVSVVVKAARLVCAAVY